MKFSFLALLDTSIVKNELLVMQLINTAHVGRKIKKKLVYKFNKISICFP